MTKPTLTRREAMRLGLLGAAGALAELVLPRGALAWGSFRSTNTHEFILRQVYAALEKDPAFPDSGFPALKDILVWEGQDAAGGTGKGPDHSGYTNYSQHYYNPRLSESGDPESTDLGPGGGFSFSRAGDAPISAATHARKFSRGLLEKKPNPKDAAWAAHFLADVWVPFHVNGCSGDDLVRLLASGVEGLPGAVYGSESLCYLCTLPPAAMFPKAVENYLAAWEQDGTIDWFDPWYWNGTGSPDLTSSHTVYEGAIYPGHRPVPAPAFQTALWGDNPEPDFQRPDFGLGRKVLEFTRKCAQVTVDNLEDYYNDPQPALVQAVGAVYTLWRASFSGLRVEVEETGFLPGSEPKERFVSCRVENLASEPVRDVRLRLRADSDTPLPSLEEVTLPLLPAGERRVLDKVWVWEDAQADQEVSLRLEAIGRYAVTPDLQFASVQAVLEPEPGECWPKDFRLKFSTGVDAWGANPTAPQDLRPYNVQADGECEFYVSISLRPPGSDGTGTAMVNLQAYCRARYVDESSPHQYIGNIEIYPTDEPFMDSLYGTHDGRRWTCENENGRISGTVAEDGSSTSIYADWRCEDDDGGAPYTLCLQSISGGLHSVPLDHCGP